ncbi:protein PIMREG [Varanus komodoensis]|uniref:protein PIMREG n=1 Tax=Varanus komodoensis TaxID=61221 RepID=UPI001CF7CA00|nr:protein PIMREG [Varanus komodoensis]
MASVFQSVGCAVGWRSHQILTEAEESPVPDRFRKRSARGVNALRMSLRKRMPLKEVEMNFEENPTWESLEAPEKSQTLQAFAGAAKSAFGTVSQRIRRGPARAASGQPPSPRTPRRKGSKPGTAATPPSGARGASPAGRRPALPSGAQQREKGLLPARRSMRTAALRSPYASPVSASQRRQFDCNLELVSTGIRRLKRLSHAFNSIIVQEERDQAVLNYYQVMARRMRAAQLRSRSLSRSSLRRRASRLRQALGNWAEDRSKQY